MNGEGDFDRLIERHVKAAAAAATGLSRADSAKVLVAVSGAARGANDVPVERHKAGARRVYQLREDVALISLPGVCQRVSVDAPQRRIGSVPEKVSPPGDEPCVRQELLKRTQLAL